MHYKVVKNIRRTDSETVKEFEAIGSATVYEAQGKRGLVEGPIVSRLPGSTICGNAVTVQCYAGDNLMIHAALEVCKPGDVLVVTTIGDAKCGMIGDLIVATLIEKGVKGLIIDSGVRDTQAIRELGFPVFSKYVSCHGTTKVRGGWVNQSVNLEGTVLHPSDLIVADDDGIVVVRYDEIDESLEKSYKRVEKEEGTLSRIKAGEDSVDFYGFRPILEQLGVKYVDE